jgi:hypothetical protein
MLDFLVTKGGKENERTDLHLEAIPKSSIPLILCILRADFPWAASRHISDFLSSLLHVGVFGQRGTTL